MKGAFHTQEIAFIKFIIVRFGVQMFNYNKAQKAKNVGIMTAATL